jgi:hypothetical protein
MNKKDHISICKICAKGPSRVDDFHVQISESANDYYSFFVKFESIYVGLYIVCTVLLQHD